MSNPNVKVIDRGWRRIKLEIAKAKHAAVKIGVQSDAGKHKPGGETDIVTIASVHEFGAPKARIPERSFIRSTADEQRETTLIMSAVQLNKIYDGVSTVDQSLGTLGQFMEDRIKAKIKSGVPPPNAEATIRAKEAKVGHAPSAGFGTHKTLIDTGQLRQSIRWAIER